MAEQTGQCVCCARKHLARAEIRAEEYDLGHPEEGWRVVGELSLAETHTYINWPDIAYAIRKRRLAWMDKLNMGLEMHLEVDDLIEQLTTCYTQERQEAARGEG